MLNSVISIRQIILLLLLTAGSFRAYGHEDIFFILSGSGTYCAGSSATVSYSAHSVVFEANNVLRVELSDAAGSFSSVVAIGSLTSEAQTGIIDISFPTTASGARYRIRIVSSNPGVIGSDNGNDLTIRQPAMATPTVTIGAPPTICADVNTEFKAAPFHGGPAPSYQWKKNGVNVGTNSPSYIDNALVTGDAVFCVMTSNRECLTTAVANSNTIDVVVNPNVTPTIVITADPATPVGAGSVIYLSSSITAGGTAPAYQWKRNGTPIATSNAFAISTLSDNDIITATLLSNEVCTQTPSAQSNEIKISVDNNLTPSGHAWEPRASQPDGSSNVIVRSNASGFSIGSKGYMGVGYVMIGSQKQYRKDFWEYDPLTDVWTQKADFAGVARYNAVGFSVGTKGYIGTGLSATGIMKDFWQYDPTTNVWTQRSDFPGTAREQAFAFGIGTKGYVGGGFANGMGDFKDFYEFDPSLNAWKQRADFGGGKRMGAAAFSIESKGFVAGGYSSSSDTWYKDFWDYDQADNLWTRRSDMPGNGRTRATGFSMAGSGYVGLGHSKNGYEGQFFQYVVSSNSWSWKPYYPGLGSENVGTGVTIGNRSFVYRDGHWVEYSLLTIGSFSSKLCSTESVSITWDASGFTFGAGNKFTAQLSSQANFSVGTNVGLATSSASTGTINVVMPSTLPSGTYYFRISSSEPVMSTLVQQLTLTTLPANHTITPELGATVCKGVPASFRSNLTGTGFQWYRNNNPVGTDSPDFVDSSLATGDVIKSVRSYSEGCKAPVGVSSNLIVMKVNDPPKPVITVVPNTLTSTVATAYQWFIDDRPIERANSRSYVMMKSGAYTVRTTDNSGCYAFSDKVVNVYVGLGDESYEDDISLYPNPAVDEVTLQLADDLVAKGVSYSVFNDLGQAVVGARPAERVNRITLADRSSGLYMVRLSLNGETIVRRFVKVE